MKTIRNLSLLFLMLLAQLKTNAQFGWAQIGVDGLTCSACTRSVEMSIRKLSFVDSVSMNLEHTEGKIIFKKGAKVDMEKVAKAVIDAGFSLRSLYAGINVSDLKTSPDFCWSYENSNYHFVKMPENVDLKGIITLQFIGEKYMSKKEFKKWEVYCVSSCSTTTSPGTLYSKSYYVSLATSM